MRIASFFIAVAFGAFLVTPAEATKIYKWKDADGTVRFSSSPPPKSQAAEVKLRKAPAAPVAAATEAKPADANKPPAAGDQMAKNCEIAQANVKLLSSESAVAGEGGNLDADQRTKALQGAQDQVSIYCK
jgi:hypothetical protein